MDTNFVLDALKQGLHQGQPERADTLTHQQRLLDAGIEPSVGTTGDSYDNALAETVNGPYKTTVIHRYGPWKTVHALELATLDWVHWFNRPWP